MTRVARTSDGAGRTEKYLASDAVRALGILASECYRRQGAGRQQQRSDEPTPHV
jgi:hypothetical protein